VGVLDAIKYSRQHQHDAPNGVNPSGKKHQFIQVIKSIQDIVSLPGYNTRTQHKNLDSHS
jgi:hypothetical protein